MLQIPEMLADMIVLHSSCLGQSFPHCEVRKYFREQLSKTEGCSEGRSSEDVPGLSLLSLDQILVAPVGSVDVDRSNDCFPDHLGVNCILRRLWLGTFETQNSSLDRWSQKAFPIHLNYFLAAS